MSKKKYRKITPREIAEATGAEEVSQAVFKPAPYMRMGQSLGNFMWWLRERKHMVAMKKATLLPDLHYLTDDQIEILYQEWIDWLEDPNKE